VAGTLRELRALFPTGEFIGIVADLATPEGAAELFAGAPDADILVNNVGTGRAKPFLDIGDREWTDLFELNVMSGVRASRHYLPNMMTRGWGRVVFISSESALAIPKDMIDYAMTKTAQLAVARGLAEVVGGTGVTVNSVLPGPTNSEIMSGWMKATAEEHYTTETGRIRIDGRHDQDDDSASEEVHIVSITCRREAMAGSPRKATGSPNSQRYVLYSSNRRSHDRVIHTG
jgi:NAD(P)-dependent dehydrogenase (short-subunit alcohol dehydrogenase family)